MDRPEWDDQFAEDNDERAERLRLSRQARNYLTLFSPDTYGLEIPRDVAKVMMQRGWIEWVPPKFGTTLYAITEKGRCSRSDR